MRWARGMWPFKKMCLLNCSVHCEGLSLYKAAIIRILVYPQFDPVAGSMEIYQRNIMHSGGRTCGLGCEAKKTLSREPQVAVIFYPEHRVFLGFRPIQSMAIRLVNSNTAAGHIDRRSYPVNIAGHISRTCHNSMYLHLGNVQHLCQK